MHICNIFTGGTIGSTLDNDGYISTSTETVYQLLDAYKNQYSCTHTMENYNPYTILSENLDANHLLKLINTVALKLDEGFDGIIIMHGTDTLQYSAAILSIVFNDIPIPIIFVSSDYILSDSRANGIINYHYAIRFLEDYYKNKILCNNLYHNSLYNNTLYGTHHVFVSYQNKGELPTIHCADMLQPPVPYSADVKSILNNYVGIYTLDEKEDYIPNVPFNSTCSILKSMESFHNLFQLPLCIVRKDYTHIQLNPCAAIMRIQPSPGLTFCDITTDTNVIIMETYHSGTFLTNEAFFAFAKKAKNLNIPILLTGLNSQEKSYETVKNYVKANIIPVYDTAVIALYCFLWLAFSNPN